MKIKTTKIALKYEVIAGTVFFLMIIMSFFAQAQEPVIPGVYDGRAHEISVVRYNSVYDGVGDTVTIGGEIEQYYLRKRSLLDTDTFPPMSHTANLPYNYTLPKFDQRSCVEYREETDWAVIDQRIGDPHCSHRFVMADWEDVNQRRSITTAEYSICGKAIVTQVARVCSKCGKNEAKTETVFWVKEEYTSEYIQTLNRIYHE